MANELAVAALIRKRAELSGDVIRLQKDIARLRTEIAALDVAIRVFDPSKAPMRIRPIIKRRTVPSMKHGEFGRSVLAVLREAAEPLSMREIAERVAAVHQIDMSTPAKRQAIIAKARNCLHGQKPETIVKGDRSGVVVWRVA